MYQPLRLGVTWRGSRRDRRRTGALDLTSRSAPRRPPDACGGRPYGREIAATPSLGRRARSSAALGTPDRPGAAEATDAAAAQTDRRSRARCELVATIGVLADWLSPAMARRRVGGRARRMICGAPCRSIAAQRTGHTAAASRAICANSGTRTSTTAGACRPPSGHGAASRARRLWPACSAGPSMGAASTPMESTVSAASAVDMARPQFGDQQATGNLRRPLGRHRRGRHDWGRCYSRHWSSLLLTHLRDDGLPGSGAAILRCLPPGASINRRYPRTGRW